MHPSVLAAALIGLAGQAHRHVKRGMPPALVGSELIAHRGWHDQYPENSMAAFAASDSAGLPFEADVHRSADGVVVVHHDDDLVRTCGDVRQINAITADELSQVRLLHQGQLTDQGIPTLAQVLHETSVGVLLEIKMPHTKSTGLEQAVARVLDDVPDSVERVMVQSFNPLVLWRFGQLRPDYRRCQLFSRFADVQGLSPTRRYLLRTLRFNALSKPDAIAGELARMTPGVVGQLRQCGYDLLAWTMAAQGDIDVARSRGIEHLICDYLPADVRQCATI